MPFAARIYPGKPVVSRCPARGPASALQSENRAEKARSFGDPWPSSPGWSRTKMRADTANSQADHLNGRYRGRQDGIVGARALTNRVYVEVRKTPGRRMILVIV